MNNRPVLLRQCAWMLAAGLLLGACENTSNRGLSALRLPSCSKEKSIFADKPYKEWNQLYHKQVDEVIEAHMKAMHKSDTQPLQCTKADQNALVKASDALKKTAEMIPAWKERASGLKESDMQVVLLEFLRVYECSMDEDARYLPLILTKDAPMARGMFSEEMSRIHAEIDREKVLAREALNRSLSLVSGFDRLAPLSLDIECLKRSSLDLRNILGLASDVSSCLPRVWDAKGSLRDLQE